MSCEVFTCEIDQILNTVVEEPEVLESRSPWKGFFMEATPSRHPSRCLGCGTLPAAAAGQCRVSATCLLWTCVAVLLTADHGPLVRLPSTGPTTLQSALGILQQGPAGDAVVPLPAVALPVLLLTVVSLSFVPLLVIPRPVAPLSSGVDAAYTARSIPPSFWPWLPASANSSSWPFCLSPARQSSSSRAFYGRDS